MNRYPNISLEKDQAKLDGYPLSEPKQKYGFTAEQARAELKRRRIAEAKQKYGFTAEQARAELERRKGLNSNALESTGKSLARGAKNTLLGALDVADLLATPIRMGLNAGASLIGSDYRFKPSAEVTEEAIDRATNNYTTNQTPDHKTTAAVVRSLASLPIGGQIGTAVKGAKYIPGLASNVTQRVGQFLSNANDLSRPYSVAANLGTTGLAAYGTQEYLNKNPDAPVGAFLSGLTHGATVPIGLAAGRNIISNLVEKGLIGGARSSLGTLNANLGNLAGKSAGLVPERVETFRQAGISPTLADVSTSKPLKSIQNAMEYMPGSSVPLYKSKDLQRQQVLEALDVENALSSKKEVGELIAKGAKAYKDTQTSKFSKMFSKLEQDIESLPDDGITLNKVNDFMSKITNKIVTPQQEKKFLSTPLGKIYKEMYQTAEVNNGKVPYFQLKEALDEINDKISTHGLIGKVSQGRLKKFAETISEDVERDLGTHLKSLGEESYKNWKQSKELYREYLQGDIPSLNDIFKKSKKEGADVFLDLIANQKKGAKKAELAFEGLKKQDQISLVNSVNQQLGANRDGSFSPLKWATGFKGLSPEGRKTLLKPLKEQDRQRLEKIVGTIDHIKGTLAEANSSKTAYTKYIYEALGGASAAGAAFARGEVMPAIQLGALFLTNRIVASQLFTNPKFINWMYRGMQAKNVNQFNKIITNVPDIPQYRKLLSREVQNFQKDIRDVLERGPANDE